MTDDSTKPSLSDDDPQRKFNPFREKQKRTLPEPAKKKPKNTRKRHFNAMAKFAEAALHVSAEDIDRYVPLNDDIQVASALLAGHLNQDEISNITEVSPARVRDALTEPLRCAWIARSVHRLASTRIGLIDAAIYARAVKGDTKAAELFYKRYGGLQSGPPAKHAHVHLHGAAADLSKMTDKDLDAIVQAEIKATPKRTKPEDE